jgi:hypothetical protein
MREKYSVQRLGRNAADTYRAGVAGSYGIVDWADMGFELSGMFSVRMIAQRASNSDTGTGASVSPWW